MTQGPWKMRVHVYTTRKKELALLLAETYKIIFWFCFQAISCHIFVPNVVWSGIFQICWGRKRMVTFSLQLTCIWACCWKIYFSRNKQTQRQSRRHWQKHCCLVVWKLYRWFSLTKRENKLVKLRMLPSSAPKLNWSSHENMDKQAHAKPTENSLHHFLSQLYFRCKQGWGRT